MIRVDISNIWGEVSLPDLLSLEKEIFDAHMALSAEGRDPVCLPEDPDEIARIQSAAERIRADSDVFVVVGAGGGCLGARAAMELLQGQHRNLTGENPKIYFAGKSLSSRAFTQLQRLLEGKDFSIALISKSGSTPETNIAGRSLRWMLERKYGSDEARYRIYAVTEDENTSLGQLAREEGWETFHIPSGMDSRYSALTAAGLLPMAVAGIDITQVLQGARAAAEEYDLRSFENPVWLYAAVRKLMQRKGKAMELLCSFEPDWGAFSLWWQQLFAGAPGQDGKGLFPVGVEFPRDQQALRQRLSQEQHSFFETMLRFDPPRLPHSIVPDFRDLDGLNLLADKSLEDVQEQLYLAMLDAHTGSGISVVTMECENPDTETIGRLFCFFQLSCVLSAAAAGENPLGSAVSEP